MADLILEAKVGSINKVNPLFPGGSGAIDSRTFGNNERDVIRPAINQP